MIVDIDKMTSDEWLAYRDDLIDSHYARGFKLTPNPDCNTCDVVNDLGSVKRRDNHRLIQIV